MIDKSLILSRIKTHLGFKKESDFAKYLGIKQNTLSTWHSRNTFDIDLISQKCDFLNYDWLLTGNGEMLKNEVSEPREEYLSRTESKAMAELELIKKLYAMQEELLIEVKKDRDRLQKLIEDKNK